MVKVDCWEARRCGLQPGGGNTDRYGVCPAARAVGADGIHGGHYGGRACWAIAGTFCHDALASRSQDHHRDCGSCDFYLQVRHDEAGLLLSPAEIANTIRREVRR